MLCHVTARLSTKGVIVAMILPEFGRQMPVGVQKRNCEAKSRTYFPNDAGL